MLYFQDDVDNDGCSYNGGNGTQRNNAYVTGKNTESVTKQAHSCAAQKREGKKREVNVRAKQQSCHVRHGKSDERHRPAKGCDHRREHSRDHQQHVACADDVHAKVFSISLAKKKHVKWLDQKHGTNQA